MSPNYPGSSLCIFVFFCLFVIISTEDENFSINFTAKAMTPIVERIEEIGTTELGEGPHWDADTQSLYFVDIFGKSIHKYVPASKKHTKAIIGKW